MVLCYYTLERRCHCVVFIFTLFLVIGDFHDEENEEENDIMTNATDCLGQLLKLTVSTGVFTPFLNDIIAPAYMPFLSSGSGAVGAQVTLQIIATCLVDDVLEFSDPSSNNVLTSQLPGIMNLFLQNLQSQDLVLKQCSAYGIAQMLYSFPDVCAGRAFTDIVPALTTLMQHPEANSDDYIGITENCCYGLGIIACRYKAPEADESLYKLARLWLDKLPLEADDKEHKRSCSMLCDAMEKMDRHVIGRLCSLSC